MTALLVALLVAATPAQGGAQKEAEEILSRSEYQRELPTPQPPKPHWSGWSFPAGWAGVFRVLFWCVVTVLALLLVAWVVQSIRGRVRDAEVPVAPPPLSPEIVAAPLAAAEALAAQGRFAEAIHVLLLRTLEVLSQNLAGRLSPALTSREILARIPLRAAAREALAGLVSAVELCHFGGSQATEGDFRICQDRFRHFASIYQGGG